MAKNNHFTELDSILKNQASETSNASSIDIYSYARNIALIENSLVVVSNLSDCTSKIFCGRFATVLGIDGYDEEDSIWEKRILTMMTEPEQDAKIISELRFYNFIRHIGKRRSDYYLKSKLRFNNIDGRSIDVQHRMYYIYGQDGTSVAFALCIYEPMSADFKWKSVAVNSVTGICEELDAAGDIEILSNRECQVLALIDSGLKSNEIADRLNISKHTVSRHRQTILSKLQVKNSIEACRMARSLQLI